MKEDKLRENLLERMEKVKNKEDAKKTK